MGQATVLMAIMHIITIRYLIQRVPDKGFV